MRRFSIVSAVLLCLAVSEQQSSAQGLAYPLFERSLEALRVEAGIPGIAAIIVQDGEIWERGLGKEDVEAGITTSLDTPFVLGGLTQAIGSSVLLRKCIDQSYAELNDLVVRWVPQYSEPETTIRQLLSHIAPNGAFQYDPVRLGALTGVVDECARGPKYAQVLGLEIFDRLAMFDSTPGLTFTAPTAADTALFDADHLARYANVIRRLAVPYRVVSRRPTRNLDPLPRPFDVARGVAASARDLATFDIALDTPWLVLAPETRREAMSQASSAGIALQTGLGWFVQAYNNEPIVWQFGVVEGAYSSLIVKVPNRRLTLILLANSDGLTAPFGLERGDVTASIFARTFLRTFVP